MGRDTITIYPNGGARSAQTVMTRARFKTLDRMALGDGRKLLVLVLHVGGRQAYSGQGRPWQYAGAQLALYSIFARRDNPDGSVCFEVGHLMDIPTGTTSAWQDWTKIAARASGNEWIDKM